MNRKADKSPFDKAQEVILGKLRAWHRAGKKLSTRRLRDEAVSLSTGCKQHFGSCRKAIEAAGLPYEGHQGRQFWNAKTTSERLKQLHRRGADLSWTGLGRLDYSLAQAAVRYFGQYATALQAAGIDYEKYRRRTTVTWDNALILKTLRGIQSFAGDLSMSGMQPEHGGLVRAAVKRFGSYGKALRAAGIDYGKVRRIRTWSKPQILGIIRKEHSAGRSIAVSVVDRSLPGFRVAADRHFGSYQKAVISAGIDYEKVRKIKSWTKPTLIQRLRELAGQGQDLRYSVMTREHGRLAYSCVSRFGTYAAAMRVAGIPYDNGFRHLSRKQVLSIILSDDKAGRDIRIVQIRGRHRGLESAAVKHFGSYGRAVEAAGLDYPPLKPLAFWTRPRVLKTLVRLHKERVDLRYATFKVTHQSLFAAARYYYGKYHRAVEAAGINYSELLRRAGRD